MGRYPAQGVYLMRLPHDYLASAGFARTLLSTCMREAPEPQDCTHVGSAVSDPSLAETQVLASAPATGRRRRTRGPVSAGWEGHLRRLRTGLCPVQHGRRHAARAVAGLADASLTETDAVKFVQTRCRELLQPRFEVRKLKNALAFKPLSFASSELVGQGARVITVMQIVDSLGDISHCVTMIDDGWLFDSNKAHALPLTRSGLDDCCLGDATFRGVVKGFHLVRATKRTKRMAAVSDSHDARKKQRRGA